MDDEIVSTTVWATNKKVGELKLIADPVLQLKIPAMGEESGNKGFVELTRAIIAASPETFHRACRIDVR